MPKFFLLMGAVNTFICIALGAFGAHGLKHVLTPEMLTIFHTGLQYHIYHALGLLFVGMLSLHFAKSRLMELAGWFMLLGIILFSVSLYVMTLADIREIGIITPFGGMSYMLAWLILSVAIWKDITTKD